MDLGEKMKEIFERKIREFKEECKSLGIEKFEFDGDRGGAYLIDKKSGFSIEYENLFMDIMAE